MSLCVFCRISTGQQWELRVCVTARLSHNKPTWRPCVNHLHPFTCGAERFYFTAIVSFCRLLQRSLLIFTFIISYNMSRDTFSWFTNVCILKLFFYWSEWWVARSLCCSCCAVKRWSWLSSWKLKKKQQSHALQPGHIYRQTHSKCDIWPHLYSSVFIYLVMQWSSFE